MTQKRHILEIGTVFLVTCLACFLIGYGFNPLLMHKNPSITANVEITENVGGLSSTLYSGNVITDIGETYVASWLGSCGSGNTTARNATQWISLSNDGSAADTWTEHPNEVAANNFTRALGTVATWTNSGDDAFNVTYTFMASGTQQLQTAGLHWSGVSDSNNNLFAVADFTQTTFNSGDTLTIKWSITVNAND